MPPVLFYALGFALVFFGVLRLVFLGLRAPKPTPEELEAARNQKVGFGLLSFLGGGRGTAGRRHTTMGILWIVMGLYVMWSGYALGRRQAEEAARESRPRAIRALVNPEGGPPARPSSEGPTLKASPPPSSPGAPGETP